MIIPNYFSHRSLKIGFKRTLDSHHINHANSILTIKPKYIEIGIENRYVNKTLNEMATFYARLINQYKFKCQTVLSARFDKQDEDVQMLDEIELYNNLIINQNLAESEIGNIDIESSPKDQIQKHPMKDSGWRFDKNDSLMLYFYKTTEKNGSSCLKIPLRFSTILNFENDDK